jgi:CRP-like cAMP-binding protein
MFGELSVLDPGPRGSTATAVTDVCRARMDRRLVLEWLAAHPEIGARLLRILARWLRRIDDDLADIIFTDVAARLASICCDWRNDSACKKTVRCASSTD